MLLLGFIYLLSLHTILHFSYLYFSTYIFVYFYICIFLYFHIFIHFCFFFHIFYVFCFNFSVISVICVSDYVLMYMWLMSVCDCMLMYVLYVSVLVYCPTYFGGYLKRARGCLLNGHYLIPWARVYRVDELWNIL